jgi:hypothetical protein
MAHLHNYDLHPKEADRVVCLACGFAVPLRMLASHTSLDAIVARKNATEAVREALATGVQR